MIVIVSLSDGHPILLIFSRSLHRLILSPSPFLILAAVIKASKGRKKRSIDHQLLIAKGEKGSRPVQCSI
jgi:hypothetical protein